MNEQKNGCAMKTTENLLGGFDLRWAIRMLTCPKPAGAAGVCTGRVSPPPQNPARSPIRTPRTSWKATTRASRARRGAASPIGGSRRSDAGLQRSMARRQRAAHGGGVRTSRGDADGKKAGRAGAEAVTCWRVPPQLWPARLFPCAPVKVATVTEWIAGSSPAMTTGEGLFRGARPSRRHGRENPLASAGRRASAARSPRS